MAQGHATGAALIVLTPDGENSIVVGAGANALLDADDVAAALTRPVDPVDVVLVQTEPGTGAAEAAAREAVRRSLRLVVNAAPTAGLSRDLLGACDPLVVNEHEARDLLREHAGDPDLPAADLGPALHELLGCRSVVVSLGAAGAVVVSGVDGRSSRSQAPQRRTRGHHRRRRRAGRRDRGPAQPGRRRWWPPPRTPASLAATAVTTAGARGYLTTQA